MRNDHVQPTIRDILHVAAGITDRAMPTDDEREERERVLELRAAVSNFCARVMERNPGWFEEESGSTDFAEARDRLTAALKGTGK